VSCLINLALAVVVFQVLRRFLSTGVSLFGALLAVVWLGASLRFFTYPVFPSLLLVLLSVHFLLGYLSNGSRKRLFLSGVLCGVSAFFRHDLGFAAGLVEMGVLASHSLYVRSGRAAGTQAHAGFGSVGVYALGMGAFVVPVAAFFISQVPLNTLVEDLVIFPITVFPKVRALPYPPLGPDTLLFYLPLGVLAAGLTLPTRRRYLSGGGKTWMLILFTVFGTLFFMQARVRSDSAHLFPVLLTAVFPACLILDELISSIRVRKLSAAQSAANWLWFAVVLAVIWSLASPVGHRIGLARVYWGSKYPRELTLERAKGIRVTDAAKIYEDMIRFIQQAVPAGEMIYVGTLRHDLVSMGDALVYFLSERHSCTGFFEIHPGLTTTRVVQEQVVGDIESSGTRWIALLNYFEKEPNESAVSSGVLVLDQYIRRNFEPVCSIDRFTILTRTR